MQEITRYETQGLGASAVLTALRTPLARGLRGNLTELRYQGRRSGRHIALPVSYARMDDTVVIYVARADTKSWWRNFRIPRPASVWIDGRWLGGTGHLAQPGSLEHEEVAVVYQEAHPRAEISALDPFVVIELRAAHGPHMLSGKEVDNKGEQPKVWRRWFASVTLGEFLGFGAPAATGALVWNAAPAAAAAALLTAGAVEGAVLGGFQARVLRSVIPGLHSRAWVFATAMGAVAAWSFGVVPVLTDGMAGWPSAVLVPAVVVGGLFVLLSLGVAQWIVLRRSVAGARQWIWATALAWLGGLLAFTGFTSPLWQPGQSAALVAAIGVVGGLIMAAVMAAVTGVFLVRIVRGQAQARS